MELRVERKHFTTLSTTGELFTNGVHSAYTLEPPVRDAKPRAIPEGTYEVVKHWSGHFNRVMPMLDNVPEFDDVLIHWGNYPKDTLGCILVGKVTSQDYVGESVAAFQPIFDGIQAAWDAGESVTVTVCRPGE